MSRTSQNPHGYSLCLASRQGWYIMGRGESRPWVEKLASIMELTPCQPNGLPKLVFIQRDPHEDEFKPPVPLVPPLMRKDLPESGWKVHDLKALRLWTHHELSDVICEIGHEHDRALDIVRMSLALAPIHKQAQQSGGLPLHGGLVEWRGTGVVLAAPGHGGKSTCCRRLPWPWQALSDDETLVVRDEQGQYFAHPFPTWSDHLWQRSQKTWNVQQHLPFSAVFFLEQAESDGVVPLSQSKAAVWINRLATEMSRRSWRNLNPDEERDLKIRLFENASKLASVVPAFKLRVSLTGRFWEEMERVLEEDV